MSAMFVWIKNNLSDDFHNCLFGFKVKNVFLEQCWAFAAKAMLLQGVGRAFIAWPYLIFVISFTQTGFLKTKFYTQKND